MMEMERPGNPDQEIGRSDSLGSIDKELDWLMESEMDKEQNSTQDDYQDLDEELFDRSSSRRGEPSSPLSDEGEPETLTDQGDQDTTEDDTLTEQQRLLEIEIQKLKEEGFLPVDDPPEYDIANRVRELNEQLRAEGEIPERTDRKVTFNEKVTAVEFPEELYEDRSDAEPNEDETGNSEQDEGGSDLQDGADNVTDPSDLEVARLTLQEDSRGTTEIGSESKRPEEAKQNRSAESPRGTDEKILIERDGKFELISVKDLSPIERLSMGIDMDPVEDETAPVTPNGHGDAPIQDSIPEQSSSPQQSEPSFQPRPPSKPRPSTASDSTGMHRTQLPPRRIQSAKTQRDSWSVSYTGYSNYGLTAEQKEHKREQMRLKMQQQQERRQAEEEQQRKKQEEAESAFQAWLQNKKEANKEMRRMEKEQKNKDDKKDKDSVDDNFQGWLHMKQEQAKRERKLKKQAEEEKVNGYFVRDRKDCDQAFKEWVKSKNKQLQKDRVLKRSSATVSRQLARQSRKSKNLAKALETAQIYRFTDYYGYRF